MKQYSNYEKAVTLLKAFEKAKKSNDQLSARIIYTRIKLLGFNLAYSKDNACANTKITDTKTVETTSTTCQN